MAKLIEINYAICLEANIEFILSEEESHSNHIGQKGILFTYVSQRKYPGMPFLVFKSERETIHTSPGELTVNGGIIRITTQQNNYFAFKIL
jgi:hypothetical protein